MNHFAVLAALALASCEPPITPSTDRDSGPARDSGTPIDRVDSGPPAPGELVISPRTARVAPGGQQPFACSIDGAAASCSFRVEEDGGGSIQATGVYTAPDAAGTYHVVATSTDDASLTDRATVTVPEMVGGCDSLASPGTWEEITPPIERTTFAFAVDPLTPGTVYLGTDADGLWKTTDCGGTWTRLDMGLLGDEVGGGMNWTVAVDPQDSQVVYANAGYGTNDLYRSDNGGVDWNVIWPPDDTAISSRFQYNFANTVDIDPFDHTHILLTFHERCDPDPPENAHTCIAESHDRGESWVVHDGDRSWEDTGEGVKIHFLENSDTWVWMSQADGLWRTTNGGESWTQLNHEYAPVNHLQATRSYRAADGTFYLGGLGELWRSPTGTSEGEWTVIPGLGPLPGSVAGDGTNLYVSRCYYGGFCDPSTTDVIFRSPESDGRTWTVFPSPSIGTFENGGILAIDRANRVLYSANIGGFWRVVLD